MSDPTLREFQRWMKSKIRPGAAQSGAEVLLNPQRDAPGDARLSVYSSGYIARVREALAEVFEATHQVLGEGVFSDLAQGYAREHPSRDYNLSFAGRHLPEFLKNWPRTSELPFLPGLAALEWRICQAFHAFEQTPMDPAQLASIAPDAYDRLQLFFQPSVSVVESPWPIIDIWQARKQPREAININLIGRPQRALIYRRQTQVLCEPINAAQYSLLSCLLASSPLGQACAKLADQDAAALSTWFSYWMSLGLITRCSISS